MLLGAVSALGRASSSCYAGSAAATNFKKLAFIHTRRVHASPSRGRCSSASTTSTSSSTNTLRPSHPPSALLSTRLFAVAPNATSTRPSTNIGEVSSASAMGPIEDTTAAQAEALGANDDADIAAAGQHVELEEHQQEQPIIATPVARRVPSTPHCLSQCGERLRSGNLVSFPTETVYGLGCHALDPSAVKKVFEAKERPLSDPLIVHVTNTLDAMELWDASAFKSPSKDEKSSVEAQALQALCSSFWPGPLTIVAKAAPSVPDIVMAGTGYVACRSPSHPVARALIDAAQVPIAAPSANKFGHVSPTRADHVLDDLGDEDVWVVDPFMEQEQEQEPQRQVCDVGVESTVAKVEMSSSNSDEGNVVVLRQGAISTSDIRHTLDRAGLADNFQVSAVVRSTGDHVAHVAPGQTIRHYSPDVVSYMIAHSRYGQGMELGEGETSFLSQAVVIDFAGRLGALKDFALAYRDLSAGGDSSEAAAAVFDALRWAEGVRGAERVYFPELVVSSDTENRPGDCRIGEEDALTLAVKDRLTRAASGIIIDTLQ